VERHDIMADNTFTLQIISPDRVFYEGEVKMVEMVTSEGEIGVLKGHIPMTNILEPGILNIIEEEGEKQAALHEGFVEILQDKVTVLAEIAEWPDEIDLNRAKEAKTRAERRLREKGGDIDVLKAELALNRALTRIKAANYKKP